MKIGLYAPDSKIPNLPLMKLSAYHKTRGDQVEFYSPIYNGTYDRVYISKIFGNSSIKYLPLRTEVAFGGSGTDLKIKLPEEIEHIYPDYSLYKIDYAMGFITRGCINNCPFCLVPKKEGLIYKHAELEEFWHGQTKLMLLDNALTDYKDASIELQRIIDNNIRLDLTQGFNVRTLTQPIAELLSKIKLWKCNSQWHIAWDNIGEEEKILRGIGILNDAGIKSYRLMCYVLVGFNTTLQQDLYRIEKLKELDIDPFVMRYKKTKLANKLAKWCNNKHYCEKLSFEQFIEVR
jgi:hypothetical protein